MASIERAELEQLIENLAPLSIRALVGERVARLTEPSQLVARAAATIAREIVPDLLSEVCDLSVDEVYDAIDEATGAGLMVEDARDVARYEFAHPLVRNAIYFGTPDDERHRIHLRVAETMEAHNERTPHAHSQNELAKHFNAALPDSDRAKAAFYAERAGRDATARLAFAESAQWYEQALENSAKLGATAAYRARLELALARAYQGLRQADPAREAYIRAASHARHAGDPVLLADIALAASTTWISGFDAEEWTQSLLEEALSELAGADDARRVRLLARLATRLFYAEPDESSRLLPRGRRRSASRSATTPSRPRRCSRCACRCRASRPRVANGSTSAATGAAPGRRRAERRSALRVRRELLTDLLQCAELDRFECELDRYERDGRDLSSPRDIYWAMALRATEATLHGDLSAGEQLARGAAVRGFDLEPSVAGAEYLQRFVIRFQQGRHVGGARRPARRRRRGPRPVYRGGRRALGARPGGDRPRRRCRSEPRGGRSDRTAGASPATRSGWPPTRCWRSSPSSPATATSRRVLDELITPCADHLVTVRRRRRRPRVRPPLARPARPGPADARPRGRASHRSRCDFRADPGAVLARAGPVRSRQRPRDA